MFRRSYSIPCCCFWEQEQQNILLGWKNNCQLLSTRNWAFFPKTLPNESKTTKKLKEVKRKQKYLEKKFYNNFSSYRSLAFGKMLWRNPNSNWKHALTVLKQVLRKTNGREAEASWAQCSVQLQRSATH